MNHMENHPGLKDNFPSPFDLLSAPELRPKLNSFAEIRPKLNRPKLLSSNCILARFKL